MSEPASLPTASVAGTTWQTRLLRALPWLVVSLPALYQLVLLGTAIAGRIGYPYDLEWMEGGMLHHAQRIHAGLGIYGPPSIDFIPYLYTPLYPSLLALFSGVFGLTYLLGRMFSVIALLGIAVVSFASIGSRRWGHLHYEPAVAGALLALGLFASTYPFVEGWFDLVRADTVFLWLVTAAIAGLPRWSKTGTGLRGHGRVAAGAAMLALAFFTKQTGIFYVALGGMIVMIANWRRLAAYVGMAALIGLGGTALLNATTKGWFWFYIRKAHDAHDFHMPRFWGAFGKVLWHIPALTIVVGATAIVLIITRIAKGPLPRAVHPYLLWTATFAVSVLVGAVGIGTEFSHNNAFMPALLHGALAAGAALPALYACARIWWGDRKHPELAGNALALAAAIPLAIACWTQRWNPQRFIPKDADYAAGRKLIERIQNIPGDVWMPSHPWYLHLAGKTPRVHRMGIKDVTHRQTNVVLGLDDALRAHAFTALVLDERDINLEVGAVTQYYRPALTLPEDERPRLYTGATIRPASIWVPATAAAPPPGAHALHDFEMMEWGEWNVAGAAWGKRPEAEALPGQALVTGTGGRRFATSIHGGDAATGRLTSPPFMLDGDKVTLALGGGTDATKLRVELWVVGDKSPLATAGVPEPGGDALVRVTLPIGAGARGKQGKLVLIDDSATGHLDADDVWLWRGN